MILKLVQAIFNKNADKLKNFVMDALTDGSFAIKRGNVGDIASTPLLINSLDELILKGGINLGAFLSQSFGTTGYQKLPGGLIIQWGVTGALSGASTGVVFPIAFPNACRHVNYILNTNNAAGNANNPVSGIANTGFTIWNYNGISTAIGYWFAIGN